MGLETLKGVDEIGGFKVINMDTLRDKYPDKFNESGLMDWEWFEKDIRPNYFIYTRHDKHSLSFTMQTKPIKEVGLEGVQVDTLVEAAKYMYEGFQKKFPCRETAMMITKLDECLMWSMKRKLDREKRGVEDKSEA